MTNAVFTRGSHFTRGGKGPFAEIITPTTHSQRDIGCRKYGQKNCSDHMSRVGCFQPMNTANTSLTVSTSPMTFSTDPSLEGFSRTLFSEKSSRELSSSASTSSPITSPNLTIDMPEMGFETSHQKACNQWLDLVVDLGPENCKARIEKIFQDLDTYMSLASLHGADKDNSRGRGNEFLKVNLEKCCFEIVDAYQFALHQYEDDVAVRESAYQDLMAINEAIIDNSEKRGLNPKRMMDLETISSRRLNDLVIELFFDRPLDDALYRTKRYSLRDDKPEGPLEWKVSEDESIILTNRSLDNPDLKEYGQGASGRVRGAVRVTQEAGKVHFSEVVVKKIPLTKVGLIQILGFYKEIRFNRLLQGSENVVASERTIVYTSEKDKTDIDSERYHADQLLSVMELAKPVDVETLRKRGYLEQLEFFQQVANGMLNLHTKGIVHNDAKLNNCGEKPNGEAVVYDFGNSLENKKSFYSNLIYSNQVGGSVPSPECYRFRDEWSEEPESFDRNKIDVWDLGVMMLSVLSKRTYSPSEYIINSLCEHYHLDTDEKRQQYGKFISDLYYQVNHSKLLTHYLERVEERLSSQDSVSDADKLVMDCLRVDPADRPSMRQVLDRLDILCNEALSQI